jgi:hypothetical protein
MQTSENKSCERCYEEPDALIGHVRICEKRVQ